MKNMIALKKLTLETKKSEIPADLANFCLDNEADEETLETWDYSKNGKIMAYGALASHENAVRDMGKYRLVTAYALEFYEADDDGEFSVGSDYDWIRRESYGREI